jgi:hypothetical protein
MPVIVDGHNLIPKIPGLSLSDLDDEIKLVEILQDFCRIRRLEIICYFDKAPHGHPRVQHFGPVTARFARPGKTADEEIKDHLLRLGRGARQWTVVSSDASIQTAARAARARIVTSDAFLREIEAALLQKTTIKDTADEVVMTPEEMEMWLKTFGGDQADHNKLS